MRRFLFGWALICATALAPSYAPAQEAEAGGTEPRRTDLVETTERRLAQIDVSVEGPREAIANLGREDFRLQVGLAKIEDFTVDNICVLPDEEETHQAEVVVEEHAVPAPVARPRPSTNFLFYFDQHHLTMAGRARSIDLALEMIPELIVNGNRGMIVSAGQDLRTFSELTDDRARLMQALRTLNGDHGQWDPWVQQEEGRIGEIVTILNDPPYDVSRALSVARAHQREERWRTQKALHLFSMVLGRMSELDPPKAVVYFADTVRKNAGDHYLSFFARRAQGSAGDTTHHNAFTAAHAFDRVLEEATAMGIRVFTIEARGLMAAPNISVAAETSAGTSSPIANTRSFKDAQDALVGMALESGGRARSSRSFRRIFPAFTCSFSTPPTCAKTRRTGSSSRSTGRKWTSTRAGNSPCRASRGG